jgi:hypothetical protein
MICDAFDTLWGETAKFIFLAEVLTSVAVEWSTPSNIVFCVYFVVEQSY